MRLKITLKDLYEENECLGKKDLMSKIFDYLGKVDLNSMVSTDNKGNPIVYNYNEYEELDELYLKIDVSKINISVILLLLRGTFTHRSKLKNWEYFRDKSYKYLKKNSCEKVDKLFKGLMDE